MYFHSLYPPLCLSYHKLNIYTLYIHQYRFIIIPLCSCILNQDERFLSKIYSYTAFYICIYICFHQCFLFLYMDLNYHPEYPLISVTQDSVLFDEKPIVHFIEDPFVQYMRSASLSVFKVFLLSLAFICLIMI